MSALFDSIGLFDPVMVSLPAVGELLLLDFCHPESGRVGCYVMDCHPFGFAASVFQFDRRAVALTSFLVRDLRLVALSLLRRQIWYAWRELAQEERDRVVEICKLLVVAVSPKSQAGHFPLVETIGFTIDVKPRCSPAFSSQEERRHKDCDDLCGGDIHTALSPKKRHVCERARLLTLLRLVTSPHIC